jgi:hypothetical protein
MSVARKIHGTSAFRISYHEPYCDRSRVFPVGLLGGCCKTAKLAAGMATCIQQFAAKPWAQEKKAPGRFSGGFVHLVWQQLGRATLVTLLGTFPIALSSIVTLRRVLFGRILLVRALSAFV